MLAPGDTFAGYTVVRELGTGGMGAVYLVQHPRLPRTDALKVLRRELCSDPAFTRRFLREAELVAGLSHRNVVPVLDRGEVDGQLWLTMAFVDGQDVEGALAAAGGRLPPERAVHVVTEVAAALDAAHRQGLVHRDVKPANILLRPGDDDEPEQVFLTDFGIAKPLEAGSTRLTRTGMVIATFDYASPEQVESRDLGPPSDVYSLGCVLYRLLSGSVPFPGDTLYAALHGHVSLPPPRPSATVPASPPALDQVVARAMAKDPGDRYPTCRALAAAARAALAPRPAPRPAPARPAPAPVTVVQRTVPQPAPATDRWTAVGPSTPQRTGPPGASRPGVGHRPPSPAPGGPAPAPGRGRRRWAAAVAVTVSVVGVTTAITVVLNRGDDDAGAGAAPTAGGASTTAGPVATTAGPAELALAALPRSAQPLPDDVVVVGQVVDGRAVLVEVDATTGESVQITSGTDDAVSPLVSPDRRSVAFASVPAGGVASLVVMPVGGGPVAPLLPSLPDGCTDPGRPAWNPSDATVLALPCTDPSGAAAVVVVTLDGAVQRTLDVGPWFGDLAFSPDGAQLVFWAAAAAGIDGGPLSVVPVDGSAPAEQLTDGSDADPDWSEQGIAFRRSNADGSRSICVLGDDDGQPECLTTGSFDQDPSWSPDGGRLAFKSDRGAPPGLSRTWTMASDGSDLQQLTEVPDDVDQPSAPAWGVR
ncbi:protein kinase domain-containing protein [Klenkia terrae]|uniref:non-specific serine/threonine protein kinase n=1 Tax=Klenkia terrae TaxID=1052259 RepID=A0ABU8E0N8_9ACTN